MTKILVLKSEPKHDKENIEDNDKNYGSDT